MDIIDAAMNENWRLVSLECKTENIFMPILAITLKWALDTRKNWNEYSCIKPMFHNEGEYQERNRY